jgi:hypothetical protein
MRSTLQKDGMEWASDTAAAGEQSYLMSLQSDMPDERPHAAGITAPPRGFAATGRGSLPPVIDAIVPEPVDSDAASRGTLGSDAIFDWDVIQGIPDMMRTVLQSTTPKAHGETPTSEASFGNIPKPFEALQHVEVPRFPPIDAIPWAPQAEMARPEAALPSSEFGIEKPNALAVSIRGSLPPIAQGFAAEGAKVVQPKEISSSTCCSDSL